MSMEKTIAAIIMVILFYPVFLQTSFAQNANTVQPAKTPEPATTPGKICDSFDFTNYEFAELIKERDEVTAEMASLGQDIKVLDQDLETALPKAVIDKKIDKQTKKDTEAKDLRLVDISSEASFIPDKSKEELIDEKDGKTEKLVKNKLMFRCMEKAIASFKTPVQDFKKTLSMIFAGLIGLVIIGFFIMAGMDATIRQAIFSGQTGIQLLTLFSIVIAIILFGITGILQDKELAALLGGLSGYILGRYSQEFSNKAPSP